MNNNRKHNPKKPKMNLYAWTHKHKKTFASIICIVIVLGMLAGLLQV